MPGPRLVIACCFMLLCAPLAAAEESAAYTISFGGVRAGILAFRAEDAGGRYTVNGSARASGLLGVLLDAEVDTVSQGRVSGNTYRPAMAREVTVGGSDPSRRTYSFSNVGVPKVTQEPAKKAPRHAAPPAQQAGTVDTTTAAFAILRDRPAALACDLDVSIYDGRRRHRITFDQAAPSQDGLTCTGRYTRVAGFSPKDMAGQTVWPLRKEYTRQPDGTMRVTRLSFSTSFGTARITRR